MVLWERLRSKNRRLEGEFFLSVQFFESVALVILYLFDVFLFCNRVKIKKQSWNLVIWWINCRFRNSCKAWREGTYEEFNLYVIYFLVVMIVINYDSVIVCNFRAVRLSNRSIADYLRIQVTL